MGESTLEDIIQSTLKLDRIDTDRSFVELGGTSLAAIEISAIYEHQTGLRVAPEKLLRSPSMASILDSLPSAGPENRSNTTGGENRDPRPRASIGQEWMIRSTAAASSSRRFQFHCAFQLQGDLDVEALTAALEDVHSHHEALRIRFEGHGDSYFMEVTNDTMSVEVLRDGSYGDRHDIITKFIELPFDLGDSQRWRALLLNSSNGEWIVCLTFDHLTADGWSLRTILDDLNTAYAARIRGFEPALPRTGSWIDYAQHEREVFNDRLQRSVNYWRELLPKKYEELSLSLPGRKPNASLTNPVELQLVLNTEEANALRSNDYTPFASATTAMAQAISSIIRKSKVRILTSAANRLNAGHERTVGWFATGIFPTYVLSGGDSLEQDLEEVSNVAAEALSFGNVPAVFVRNSLWPESPPGYREDTGIYLSCDGVGMPALDLQGTRASSIHLQDRSDTLGIHFFLIRDADTWIMKVYYHEGEYTEDVVADLVSRFRERLHAIGRYVGEQSVD